MNNAYTIFHKNIMSMSPALGAGLLTNAPAGELHGPDQIALFSDPSLYNCGTAISFASSSLQYHTKRIHNLKSYLGLLLFYALIPLAIFPD